MLVTNPKPETAVKFGIILNKQTTPNPCKHIKKRYAHQRGIILNIEIVFNAREHPKTRNGRQ